MRIVLVYLGEHIPKYFWKNLENLLRIQNGYNVDVVLSKNTKRPLIANPRVIFFEYETSAKTRELLNNLDLDSEFRSGFWRYSLERIFVLFEHHQKSQTSLLHFESDILALPNFPFAKFNASESLYWAKVDADRDSPAIIYLPEFFDVNAIEELMRAEVAKSTKINDMELLSRVMALRPNQIKALPIFESVKSEIISDRVQVKDDERTAMCQEFKYFGGIFDPAGIGIWLTGSDPRNYFGVTKKFTKNSLLTKSNYVDPSKVEYEFSSQAELSFRSHDQLVPVFNLHIHSKKSRYFGINSQKLLLSDIKNIESGRERKEFSFLILISLLFQNARKGTLLSFLSWIPVVRKLQMFFKHK